MADRQQIMNDLISKFNTVIMGMINHITDYYGDSNMIKMKIILENIINTAHDQPMTYFLMNVYMNDKYRSNILKQNDDFFLNENYDTLTENDNSKITQLFQFKDLWKQIDIDTKNFIKKSMIALVKISQKYILIL